MKKEYLVVRACCEWVSRESMVIDTTEVSVLTGMSLG